MVCLWAQELERQVRLRRARPEAHHAPIPTKTVACVERVVAILRS